MKWTSWKWSKRPGIPVWVCIDRRLLIERLSTGEFGLYAIDHLGQKIGEPLLKADLWRDLREEAKKRGINAAPTLSDILERRERKEDQ